MIERSRRDVADAPAGGEVALLPLLLVPGAGRRALVERSDASERARADREVRAPPACHVAVDRSVVCARDRRCFATARASPRRASLEARMDRPREHADLGQLAPGVQISLQPPRCDFDVVIDEDEQLARGGGSAHVACRVEPARRAEREVACAPLGRQRLDARVAAIVDDDHLRGRRARLRHGRCERHREVVRPPTGRDDDRCGHAHCARESTFASA